MSVFGIGQRRVDTSIGNSSSALTSNNTGSGYAAGLIGGGGGGGGGYVPAITKAQIEAAQALQGMNMNPYRDDHKYDLNNDNARKMMIAMRLRLEDGVYFPFEHLSTAKAGDKVFIFVVQNNQPVTLEDEAGMFPSDTLVTQLRLLMK